MAMRLPEEQLTYVTIGCLRRVCGEFGPGLLESGYTAAVVYACRQAGLSVEREVVVPLYFDGAAVAHYRMDIVIDRRLLVELKACRVLRPDHIKQVMHYLRLTDLELALLFNFGEKPELKRFTLRNCIKRRPQTQVFSGDATAQHE